MQLRKIPVVCRVQADFRVCIPHCHCIFYSEDLIYSYICGGMVAMAPRIQIATSTPHCNEEHE